VVLHICCACTAFSQQKNDMALGSWYMLAVNGRISEHFSVPTNFQIRYYEQLQDFNQIILRVGLNYHLNSNTIAALSYGYVLTDTESGDDRWKVNRREHQLAEQMQFRQKVGRFELEHRPRVEQRFVDLEGENALLHRARYRFQALMPITPHFFLLFNEELFVNLQDYWYGQNRVYGAIGLKFKHDVGVQVGFVRNSFRQSHNDRLQLAFFFAPDLRKKVEVNL
jgi:hypothetical protein